MGSSGFFLYVLFCSIANIDRFQSKVASDSSSSAKFARNTDTGTCDKLKLSKYAAPAAKIIQYLTSDEGKGQAYDRLAYLTDTFGHRMVGSKSLEKTIEYLLDAMKAEGLDNVHKEIVRDLPYWVRGHESAVLISPRRTGLKISGLGGTVATPQSGLCASAIVVDSFDQLLRLGDAVRGKIVVYNQPWKNYGQSVAYRSQGASKTSRQGAVAVLVRSATSKSVYSPHTGSLTYSDDVPPIPAASLTVEDAEMLDRMQSRKSNLKICLNITSRNIGSTESHNTVAEILGSEMPNEIVMIGGHLDSWDVGTGAMDDGGGVIISWQALSVLKALNLRPKRTIRAVFWTAEEQGYLGCSYYFTRHRAKSMNETFRFVYESDNGAFKPVGLAFYSNNSDSWCKMSKVMELLAPINASKLMATSFAGDVDPWRRDGVPAAILTDPLKNDYYFTYHHSQGDNVIVFDPKDLDYASALTAIVAYVIADMDYPL